MAETRQVLSVGIDIGTTTSQFVLSRLTVSNQARGGLVPRLGVEGRAVLYQSQPHLTPLAAPDRIDVAGVLGMIHREYELAGIDAAQVESGAVIVTGETARTRNAEAILNGLSDLAGEFVVTVAGPALEAQIAGRGSGACDWSTEHYATVVNVDIGGGSSNAALFRSGKHIGSAAAMVGGRQAMVDPATGILTHLKPAGATLVDALGLDLVVGRRTDVAALRRLTDVMADVVVDLVLGNVTPLTEIVALTAPLALDGPVAACFVSGGVGHVYYEDQPCSTLAQVARYGDVGPLLARSLRENPRWQTLRIERPAQTLRATVLGASSQQVTLSGSTIWTDPEYLPLKNLPVVEPRFGSLLEGHVEPRDVRAAVDGAVRRWDLEADHGAFAIVLDLPERLAYRQVVGLADGLADFASDYLPPLRPLVLVTEEDYAQVLGQTLKGRLPDQPVVVVDQIGLDEGDFIDIGEPLFDGRVVPVSVKTLVFYQ
ncbi:ethanolamine utilization protein EutA [Xylanimonas allomyrinae]|uniref:Ethanolamine utilization protein EutA n=1 Tax=Xylanimonas allomyrinae TaxID=2509459 RepID=A0A4P6EM10_9MICO|nr:ethanolamine ammonia-lyase reactivating factor EutA [Xylanimonas allomyrinae]QAY63316.1 ethanolamine utilization protein EutA [Xylanimonas allomyrinae]